MPSKNKKHLTQLVTLIGTGLLATTITSALPYVIHPTKSNEQLRTPGVGFQETISSMPSQKILRNCNYDTSLDSNNKDDVKAGSVYVRMMWQDFEPAEGRYDFKNFDKILNCARKKGQTVDLRIMMTWPIPAGDKSCDKVKSGYCIKYESLPKWLLDKGIDPHVTNIHTSGTDYYDKKVPPHNYYMPNWENKIFRDAHAALIKAFGKRYNGHPDLNSVDIGSAGLWGEWHIYGAEDLFPNIKRQREIIDLYARYFSATPLVPLGAAYNEDNPPRQVAYGEITAHLKKLGLAWREDSWGNKDDYTNSLYSRLNKERINAWKKSPVVFESSDILESWVTETKRFKSITDGMNDALNWHASLLHNKGNPIPDSFKRIVNKKAKQLGFRLVLKKASFEDKAYSGKPIDINLDWKNIGVAPPYRDYRIALRLRDIDGKVLSSSVNISNKSVRGWLPEREVGTIKTSIPYIIPHSIPNGDYSLDVAIVFNTNERPFRMLPIAVTGREDDDWYNLGGLNIQ